MAGPTIENSEFRRILTRNVALPLGMSIISAVVFVGIIAYLINNLTWVEHSQKVISGAHEIRKLSAEMEAGMRGYLLAGDEEFLSPYMLSAQRMGSSITSLAELVKDNAPQAERVTRIGQVQEQWESFAQEMIKRRRANDVTYIDAVTSGRGKILTDEMRRHFDLVLANEGRLLQERSETARSTTFWSVALFLLLSAIVGASLAAFGRRQLVRLSDTYNDVLAHEAENNDKLRHQDWLRTGQNDLNVRSAGQINLEPLADAVLPYVVKYLDGVIGAMYVRSEDGAMRRIGAYGFTHTETERAEIIAPGSTLASKAAEENRLMVLDQLPDGYIKVSTSLGEASPRALIIAPFHNHGKVKGVFEIAFLRPVELRDREFLGFIAQSVGAAMAAVLYRQRLQDALEESQTLNEELQVQQEELRTANEELEEQSRALEESQSALENQQAELRTTNDQLAEQALNLDMKNSALQSAQEQLQHRAVELESASRYKSEFLANMSHELRTPLNSSLILAKLLSDNTSGNLSDEQVRFAQTIYSAGNDLLQLINDILDISKVEAGKLELVPEDVPVRRVVEGLARTFEPLARQKALEFKISVDPGVPASLHTDRQRMEQILKNLLSNAVKFTEVGAVSLTVSATPEGDVAFRVQDTGIGIATDQQDKIFDAFHQADGTTSRRFGGTGLGLSITRDLTRLLGGSVAVSSAPNEGSVFTLVLPRGIPTTPAPPELAPVPVQPAHFTPAPAPIPAATAATTSAASGEPFNSFPDDRDKAAEGRRTVLVVEDEVPFARILYDLARELDYRCLVAMSAEEGLALAVSQRPDAVLLDVRLPDRSGLTVLQQLKDNPSTRHIPVHVISSIESGGEALHLAPSVMQ